jgi:hypothetical protein
MKAVQPIQTSSDIRLDAPYPDAMPKDLARKFREKRK